MEGRQLVRGVAFTLSGAALATGALYLHDGLETFGAWQECQPASICLAETGVPSLDKRRLGQLEAMTEVTLGGLFTLLGGIGLVGVMSGWPQVNRNESAYSDHVRHNGS